MVHRKCIGEHYCEVVDDIIEVEGGVIEVHCKNPTFVYVDYGGVGLYLCKNCYRDTKTSIEPSIEELNESRFITI